MNLRWVLFILMLHAACGEADAQLKVTTLRLGRDNGLAYSFPLVHSANKKVGDKINVYLQKEILYNDTISTDSSKVFEKSRFIGVDSIWQAGYTDISYEIAVENSRVLSFVFQLETMGAYPEGYPAYYNFNVQTGAPVFAKDLFTPAGITAIQTMLIRERKTRITAWIKEMDTTYSVKDDYEYIKETFNHCNEKADEDNFSIKQNSIVFCKENCFPHVARPYDTDLDVELNFSSITRYLNDNGKRLLLQKR